MAPDVRSATNDPPLWAIALGIVAVTIVLVGFAAFCALVSGVL